MIVSKTLRSVGIVVLLLLTHSLLDATQEERPSKVRSPKPLRIPLVKVSVKKGVCRLGFGYRLEIPVECWQATLPKGPAPPGLSEAIQFFDLGEDGELTSGGTDGFAFAGSSFIVQIPDRLLMKSGQYRVTFDGLKAVILTAEDLGIAQKYVSEASVFTELRLRSGLTPVPLEADLTSACEKHCDYLKVNGMLAVEGLSVHQEDASKPGYTEEGAEAGRNSNISPGCSSVAEAMRACFATAWHGAPMVNPCLSGLGVGSKNGVTLIHLGRVQGIQEAPNFHPADGATAIPPGFGERGEYPNPVPGSDFGRGCGFPILVRLLSEPAKLISAEVTDPQGRRIAGSISCPMNPASPEWPSNSNCALFIPKTKLLSRTVYRVVFRFQDSDKPMTWSFTTGQ